MEGKGTVASNTRAIDHVLRVSLARAVEQVRLVLKSASAFPRRLQMVEPRELARLNAPQSAAL
jgi:hypothetical protein